MADKLCVHASAVHRHRRLASFGRGRIALAGADLKVARQRRGESLRTWASRMGVSVPTLVRMEGGEPAVGIGVYATALYLAGRHRALGDVARPEDDAAALAAEIERARRAHAAPAAWGKPRARP